MSDFPNLSYSYLYSDPPDPNEQLPPLFFNTLPYRKSRFHETATSTSLDVIKRVAQDWSKSPKPLLSRGCIASAGHMVSWVAPELPPELIPVMTEMSELLLHYDGNEASFYRVTMFLCRIDEIDALDAQRVRLCAFYKATVLKMSRKKTPSLITPWASCRCGNLVNRQCSSTT
jgi:hypothetical protein